MMRAPALALPSTAGERSRRPHRYFAQHVRRDKEAGEMSSLRLGSRGPDVARLQMALRAHGFNPGATDGTFDESTLAAVLAFQKSERLLADGIVGPRTSAALGLIDRAIVPSVLADVTVHVVAEMFPGTPTRNIELNLPTVLQALIAPELTDKPMVLMSLATIRAETAGFVPISEGQSRFNTSPGGHPFDLYDNRKDLGNTGAPDGERYRGRGFVQLTGRANYDFHGAAIGVPELVDDPDRANEPDIAAQLLASFLKVQERRIKEALLVNDFAGARRLVNGGSHGLDEFVETFRIGQLLLPDALETGV
jgi:putative chitinase